MVAMIARRIPAMRNAGIKGVVEPSRLERSVGDADGDGVDVSDWIAIF